MKNILHWLIRFNIIFFAMVLVAISLKLMPIGSDGILGKLFSPQVDRESAILGEEIDSETAKSASDSLLSITQAPVARPKIKPTSKPTTPTSKPNNPSPTAALTNVPIPTDQPAPPATKMSQLALHNTATDCWMSYQGHVYDFTSYLAAHPGGRAAMSPYCGQNMDQAYATKGTPSGSSHSAFAQSQLAQYLIE